MRKNSESRERILKVSKKDTKISSLRKNEVSEDYNVNDLRPQFFSDYVGQEIVVESIEIAVAAAKKRDEPLDHSLFHGPPGLGKTTIAHIIARQIGSKLIHTSGPALDRPADVVGLLSNLKRSDVLFIDEIHRLSSSVEEYLYSAMEDFRVDFVTGSGAFAKTINLPLLPFTLIGSTTRVGMLSAPLRERFGLTYHLDYYSSDELSKVIIRSAGILNLEINLNSAKEIAKRSRGTPRIANRLLRRVRDYCQVKYSGELNITIVTEALDKEGVDYLGLDRLDRIYLNTLAKNYQGGPAGIQALAATVNEDQQTLEDVVEPFLLKIGFIVRTSQGRKITVSGMSHIGYSQGNNSVQGKLV
ncbi:MAG: Holliday junction branch migration DNA helicase RuvB [Chloroflexi bacterium]|nr:Holliday junction branch migration DNA helicase RuvB [Chloroflexota bacterium]|tara:strand:- start:3618 stop:4691 length:1074 start_codon:yes stop_codon:yes gene_type:complete